ncbi:hypothetical protein E4U31_001940 [Claviceps sp. LM219 group G6]|nr:hypothetical protein E4U31_001940 [Claviceps sp. LM219 group G6]
MYFTFSALVAAAAVLPLCSAVPPAVSEPPAPTSQGKPAPTVNPGYIAVCPLIYAPVCAGGKTYPNDCTAKYHGASVEHSGPCKEPAPEESDCICTAEWDPVCGDGKTYGNICMAHCAKAQSITEGECPKLPKPRSVCACPDILKPVCGDGETYANICEAHCAKAQSITEGECPKLMDRQKRKDDEDVCFCPDIWDPACGDGVTHANSCFAQCAKAKSITPGECPKSMDSQKKQDDEDVCFCPDIWDPACGDGVTHANTCFAQCAKAKSITPGACPKLGRRQERQKPCTCPRIYWPVCGDGKTYANICEANCAKAQSITEGECPKLPDPTRA